MAHARVLDVDEDFLWARLCHWDLLVLKRASDLVDDLSPLLGRDLSTGHSDLRDEKVVGIWGGLVRWEVGLEIAKK